MRWNRRRLSRLQDMPITEIAYRGWQEAFKWVDRVAPGGREVDLAALVRSQAPAFGEPDSALSMVRNVLPARFFAGVEDPRTIALLEERAAAACCAVVASAEPLLERHFRLLGHDSLWFGDPIDWHLDPLASTRAPLEHWSHLDPLDTGVVGDSKVVWELNRHQWLVRLAQAHALTGEERYAEGCVEAIDQWIDANPPGFGINWASSLEVAYRLIAWCWTILILRRSRSVSGAWIVRALGAIWLHATHVRRYLSYYYSPNTHLTGEALGLFYAGTIFSEFHDAARWRALGARILLTEIESQTSPDGVHFEQATCYHRYTVEIYQHFLLLGERNGLAAGSALQRRLAQMVGFLLALRHGNGSIPAIGDADGGAVLPLEPRAPSDARGTFGVAAAMFDRADFAWAADGLPSDVLWLLGEDGLRAFDAIGAAPPVNSESRVFPSGGYAVMRSAWTPDAHQLIVDVGPLGCPISSGHGHADLLSIQCAIFGEPCLVDPGTYCYTADPEWRDYFRGTQAHSAVMVDGQGQAQPAGPFGWHQRPRVRLHAWHSDGTFDFLDADHDAYGTLPDPVTCRRRVIFVKPHYWLVIDDLIGSASHRVDLAFQFAPMQVTLDVHPWARAETPGGRVLWTSTFPAGPIQASIRRGRLDPVQGWVSGNYGRREAAPMLVYSCAVTLPWRLLTILLPDPQTSASPPPVRPIYDDKGLPTGLVFERSRRSVRFDDRQVIVTSA